MRSWRPARNAGKRCQEIAERFGDDVLCTIMQIMLERNHMAIEQNIKMVVPEAPACFEDLSLRRRRRQRAVQDCR